MAPHLRRPPLRADPHLSLTHEALRFGWHKPTSFAAGGSADEEWFRLIADAHLDMETIIEAIEALGDGIAIYDANARPLYANGMTMQRFGRMYADMEAGMSYREALEETVRRLVPNAPAEEVDRLTAHFLRKFYTGETYASIADDGRAVMITFRPMSNGMRAAISVDVTELRKREKELERAKRAAETASQSKSSFLANMSHEIRTPLNGVLGMAQVMATTQLDQTQREHLNTIIETGKTLMALLNDVLDLSKIEAGKFDIVAADTNITHMMRRQLALWKPRAEEKGLELALAFDADLPAWGSIDAVRVQQCVSNLLSNAIKFTAEGRVEAFVNARPLPHGAHMIEVVVRDTGPGMDLETLGRLFKPFAQADETISRRHGGTGLGLSITKRLAELMGGTASATSAEGRGSTFRFSFRAAPAKAGAMTANRPLESGDVRDFLKSSKLRVLLVDDHPINRQIASLFLRPFNMRIVEAVNGAEALAALERETFDIVLLDMHMPVMDGPTAIARIRASGQPWAKTTVIALTADAMSGDRERYLAMGMDGYLSKPLAERDLLSEIARLRHVRETSPVAKAG
jgi:signal transduction histidine kinase/ActR/RegA family two-component response regulator